jgi:hypothetical protein
MAGARACAARETATDSVVAALVGEAASLPVVSRNSFSTRLLGKSTGWALGERPLATETLAATQGKAPPAGSPVIIFLVTSTGDRNDFRPVLQG